MIRIDHYVSFCKIIELGSFSAAAEVLGISQSAISQQMKTLENLYGSSLLHRSGSRVLMTEDGEKLQEYALQILSLYERSMTIKKQKMDVLSGRIAVGASSGPAEFPVPIIMGLFKKKFPGVKLSLHVNDSSQVIEDVLKQKIEIGFVGMEIKNRSLDFKPFFRDQMIFVVPSEHPFAEKKKITFEEFLSCPLIIQQRGAGITEFFLKLLAKQDIRLKDLNVIMELGLQDSTKAAVMGGFGTAFISLLGGIRELRSGDLVHVEIEGLQMERPQYLCTNRSVPLSNIAVKFLEFAKSKRETIISDSLVAQKSR